MQTPTVSFKSVDSLLPYARNARTHSGDQVAQLAASILEWGWTNPILADDRGVVAGHGRLAAARLLYAEGKVLRLPNGQPIPAGEVPVLDVSGWPESKRRAYVLADNKLALGSGWDTSMLAEELRSLQEEDFDLGLAGFSDEEASRVLSGLSLDSMDFSTGGSSSSGGPEVTRGDNGGIVYNDYSRKIVSPVYEITGERPELSELYTRAKTEEVLSRIEEEDLPTEVAEFLRVAAERHTRFHFGKIAEFYAHAEPRVQRLFEDSVLVIIDFDQAIERGFVRLNSRLDDMLVEESEAVEE